MLVRIATRASPLARWQADHVASLIRTVRPDVDVAVEPLSTEGDRRTDVPLSEIGGKGVFATEVQAALLDGRADVAVHSGKDLPARTPDGLVIAAVPERGDVRDALVGSRLVDLPTDGAVATGSARRRGELAPRRPGHPVGWARAGGAPPPRCWNDSGSRCVGPASCAAGAPASGPPVRRAAREHGHAPAQGR